MWARPAEEEERELPGDHGGRHAGCGAGLSAHFPSRCNLLAFLGGGCGRDDERRGCNRAGNRMGHGDWDRGGPAMLQRDKEAGDIFFLTGTHSFSHRPTIL